MFYGWTGCTCLTVIQVSAILTLISLTTKKVPWYAHDHNEGRKAKTNLTFFTGIYIASIISEPEFTA